MDGRTKSVRVRFEKRQVCDYTDVKNRESLKCRMENFSVTEDDTFEPIGDFPEMSFRLRTAPHEIASIDMPEHDFTLAPAMPASGFGRYDHTPMQTDFIYNVVLPQDRALESYRTARAAGGNPGRPPNVRGGVNIIQAQMAGVEMSDILPGPSGNVNVNVNVSGNVDPTEHTPEETARLAREETERIRLEPLRRGVYYSLQHQRGTQAEPGLRDELKTLDQRLEEIGRYKFAVERRIEEAVRQEVIRSRLNRDAADIRGFASGELNPTEYTRNETTQLASNERQLKLYEGELNQLRRTGTETEKIRDLENKINEIKDYKTRVDNRVEDAVREDLRRAREARQAREAGGRPAPRDSGAVPRDNFATTSIPDAARHANNARSQAVRQTGARVSVPIPMVEMIDMNAIAAMGPPQQSSLDPMRRAPASTGSIPQAIIREVERIMPIDLPPTVTERIPYPPDPTRAGMVGYDAEMAHYNIRLQRLFNAIERVTPDGQDRWLLRRQIELHIETVRLRAQGGLSGITPNTRSLEVQFGMYNRLARMPIADRPSINPTTGELYHPSLGMAYLPENIFTRINIHTPQEYLTTYHPNMSLSDINAAFDHIHSEFGRVVSQFPHVPQQPINQTFAVTAQRQMTFLDSVRGLHLNPMSLVHGGSNMSGNIIVGMLVGSALEQSDAFHGLIGAAGMGAIAGAASSVAGAASETIVARGVASSARFAAMALPTHMALSVAGASAASASVSLARNLLQHAAQGLIIGALVTPIDMMFQDYLIRHGFSAPGAGALSGAVTGALAVGAAGAIAAGVASFNAGALTLGAAGAPETFGLSMAFALGSIALSSAIGAIAGIFSERSAREDRNRHNLNRMTVMNMLPQYNWDWHSAQQAWELQHFGHVASPQESDREFGDYNTEMRPFRDMIEMRFNGRAPPADSPLHQEPPSRDSLSNTERRTMDLMRVAMNAEMYQLAARSGNMQLANTIHSQPGFRTITSEEYMWLDDNTHYTWAQEVDLMAAIEYGQLQRDAQLATEASVRLYAAWENNHTLPDPESADYRLANLNPEWQANFIHNVGIDAQRIIINNFQTSGMRMDQNTNEVQFAAMANDYNFIRNFNNYANEMTTTAARYNLTVQQLVGLQQEPNDAIRARQFQVYQYNTLAHNTQTVHEAAEMAIYLQNIRGQGFYDRDQYEMDSDPDSRSTWNPLDSQIYQAHELGMTMQQYIDYLHQLGLGDAGSFNNLPEYTPDQLATQRALDLEHFNAELLMSGHSNMFTYDSTTFMWHSTDPNAPPGTRRMLHSDPYLPANFESSTQSFHNMIHGQNLQNQAEVDAYNAALLNELDTYEMSFYGTADPYNTYVQNFGGQYRHFDRAALYRERAAVYTPASENIRDYMTVVRGGHTVTVQRSEAMDPSMYTRVDYQGTTMYFDNAYYNSIRDSPNRDAFYATFAQSINNQQSGSSGSSGGRRQLTPGRVLSINASGTVEEIDASAAQDTSMYSQIIRNGQTIYLNTNYRNYLIQNDAFDTIDSRIETFYNTPAPPPSTSGLEAPSGTTPGTISSGGTNAAGSSGTSGGTSASGSSGTTGGLLTQSASGAANNDTTSSGQSSGRIGGGHEFIDDGF